MIASISYALVLFVHPSPEPRVYASFPTAEACRTERAAVARDLEGSQITAACVPQERLNMNLIESQMQIIMNTMRNLHQDLPQSKDF
jgi:hypothetical protein